MRYLRSGFTFLEIAVTLVLIGVAAAFLLPILTQQLAQGDPVRLASDLSSVKLGVQAFRLDVSPDYPGDLEDLAFRPSSDTEHDAAGGSYSSTVKGWRGPYLESSLEEGFDEQETGDAIPVGGEIYIQNDVVCFDTATASSLSCSSSSHQVAIKVSGLSTEAFMAADEVIDGTADAEAGNFRYPGPPFAFYLIGPYR